MINRYSWARRVLAAVGLFAWAGWVGAVSVGDAAPDFHLPGLRDNVKLAALQGKLVYLDFWASWCGPCKQSFPWMNELQARFGAQGLQVIAVNVDTNADDARRFLADVPARFTVAFDTQGDTPRRYAIKGMPTSVLITPDGKVMHVHSGFRPEDRAALELQIQQALTTAARRTTP